MKIILKPILALYLKCAAKLALLVHRPKIIAVSGSINKSFFKDEIRRVLMQKGLSIRANEKSFNTEIGLPLAILDLPSGYNSYRNWRPAITGALVSIFKTGFPKVLVLELGVSHPGDMRYLMSIIKPDVSVITDITQRYLEGFSGMDDLAGEYEMLVKNTKIGGAVVFNGDNQRVREIMKKTVDSKKISFGKANDADWRITEMIRGKSGEVVKMTHDGKAVELETGRFGEHHAYSCAAAQAVISENFL